MLPIKFVDLHINRQAINVTLIRNLDALLLIPFQFDTFIYILKCASNFSSTSNNYFHLQCIYLYILLCIYLHLHDDRPERVFFSPLLFEKNISIQLN